MIETELINIMDDDLRDIVTDYDDVIAYINYEANKRC